MVESGAVVVSGAPVVVVASDEAAAVFPAETVVSVVEPPQAARVRIRTAEPANHRMDGAYASVEGDPIANR